MSTRRGTYREARAHRPCGIEPCNTGAAGGHTCPGSCGRPVHSTCRLAKYGTEGTPYWCGPDHCKMERANEEDAAADKSSAPHASSDAHSSSDEADQSGQAEGESGDGRHEEEEDGDDGDSADPSSLAQSDEGDEEQSACAAGSRCRKPGNTKAAVVKTRCCGLWAHMGCASMCAYCYEGGGSAGPAGSQDSASAPVPATSTDAVGHSSLHQADDGVARNYNLSRDNSGHLSRAQCPTPSHDGGGMTMGGGQQHPVAAQQGFRTHGSPYSGQPSGPHTSGHLHNDGGMAGGGGQRSTAVQHGAVMYAAPGPEATAGHLSPRTYTLAAPRAHQDSPGNGFQYDPPGRGRSTDNGQTAAQLLSTQAHQRRSTGEDRRAGDDYQAQHRVGGRAGGPEPGDSVQQTGDGTNATRAKPARGYGGGDGEYNSSEVVEVEVIAAPHTPDAATGPDEQRTAPFKGVPNPYQKDTRASGSNQSRLGPSPGSRAPSVGAPLTASTKRRPGYIPGVGVATPSEPNRRRSGRLSVQPSPAPAPASETPTEVIARVDNVHLNKSVQTAVAHAVPKHINSAVTGSALKKAMDAKDFTQSVGAVVKQQLSAPSKKFKEDVRKSAADAAAEGVANILQKPLKQFQQVINASTKAQEQQSAKNAKTAAALQQVHAAMSKSSDGKKGKGGAAGLVAESDIDGKIDSVIEPKIKQLRQQISSDVCQHMTALLAELQNYTPGGAGHNIARATSSIVRAGVTQSLDGLAQQVATRVRVSPDKGGGGPTTPERKASNSTAGIGEETISRVLKSLASRNDASWFRKAAKRNTAESPKQRTPGGIKMSRAAESLSESWEDTTSQRMGVCGSGDGFSASSQQGTGAQQQQQQQQRQRQSMQIQSTGVQQRPMQGSAMAVQQQHPISMQPMQQQQQPMMAIQTAPTSMGQPQQAAMQPGGMQQQAMAMTQQHVQQQLPTTQQTSIFGDGVSRQVPGPNGAWAWGPMMG